MIYQQIIPQAMYSYIPAQPQPPQVLTMPEFKALSLSIELPSFTYNTSKIATVPFDLEVSNNGRFTSVEAAMRFLSKHCHKYHRQFNRQLARQYSPHCFVMDFISGQYVPLTEISKKEFSAAFNSVSKASHK